MEGNGSSHGSWRGRLKSILGGGATGASRAGGARRSGVADAGPEAWPGGFPTTETLRSSRGLEHFLTALREQPTASAILDLGGANQENISFITSLGHRISSENLLYSLDQIWNVEGASEARRIEDFLTNTLNYQESTFSGVLVWDTLQYLPQPLLEAVVERLQRLLCGGAQLFTLFPADEKARTVPACSYRIVDPKSLLLTPRGLRRREHCFNNRALERMFQEFAAVKFFLTRDHLREVLVRR